MMLSHRLPLDIGEGKDALALEPFHLAPEDLDRVRALLGFGAGERHRPSLVLSRRGVRIMRRICGTAIEGRKGWWDSTGLILCSCGQPVAPCRVCGRHL